MKARLRLLALLALTVLALLGPPVAAQEASSPAPPTALELRTLLELLEDPAVRAWLRRQVDAMDGAAGSVPVSTFSIAGALRAVEDRIASLQEALRAVPSELSEAWLILDLELDESSLRLIVLSIAGLLAIGAILEWLFWRLTQRFRRAVAEAPLATSADRIRVAGLRLLLALLGVVVFTAGSVGVFLTRPWPPIVGLIVLTYLTAFVYYRLAHAFARFAFAPAAPRLRLLPLTDAQARFLSRGTLILVALAAIGFLTCSLLEELGIAPYSVELLRLLTMLALALSVILLRLGARRLAPWETGARHPPRPLLAQAAPWIFLAAVVLWWLLQVLDLTVLATLLLIATLLPAALRLCNAVATGLDRPAGESPAAAAMPETPHLGVLLIGRGLRGLVILLAAWIVLDTFRSRGMMMADSWLGGSEAVVRAIFTTLIAYVIADLIWQVLRHAIERRIREEATPEQEREGEAHSIAARSRMGTLLPLVKSVVGAFLIIAVAMIGLSTFGVDIGPLLAGAGVIGIAIGFGAQALVRDIFSGVFFLVDDAFRLGEYIEIESLRGTVEAISVRSMRLRHHRGAVHTIPYGEVRSITNYSRDWVIVKLEFRIPFDTDLALVKRLVKQIGRELQDDPVLGPNLIEPLKSQGVRRVEEYNAVLGVKFMAKPGEQFTIRREAYHRILKAFEANGIQLASRSVRVEAPSGRDGEAVAAQAFADEDRSGGGGPD
ncbi:MAG TPA: mechanosensitive ion channel family protein [Kiloniellales bacterium]|nr:mechanosensitive ion channel family protein [Kiloniellales bacterium]